MFIAKLHEYYDPNSIYSGHQIYQSYESVQLLDDDNDIVSGIVQGNSEYLVVCFKSGPRKKPRLEIGCSCPYFTKGHFCKHTYAFLMYVDTEAEHFKIPKNFSLVHDDSLVDVDLGIGQSSKFNPVDEYLEDPELPFERPNLSKSQKARKTKVSAPKAPSWSSVLNEIDASTSRYRETPPRTIRETNQPSQKHTKPIVVLDLFRSKLNKQIVLEVFCRQALKNGGWGKCKPLSLQPDQLENKKIARSDLEALELLQLRAQQEVFEDSYGGYSWEMPRINWQEMSLSSSEQSKGILKKLCEEKMLCLQSESDSMSEKLSSSKEVLVDPSFLVLENFDINWSFGLRVEKDNSEKHWLVKGFLYSEDKELGIDKVDHILIGGVLITDKTLCSHDFTLHYLWYEALSKTPDYCLKVPIKQQKQLLKKLFEMESLPRMELPPEFDYETQSVEPVPHLELKPDEARVGYYDVYLSFKYGNRKVDSEESIPQIINTRERKIIPRNLPAEKKCLEKLNGVTFLDQHDTSHWTMAASKLTAFCNEAESNWEILLEKTKIRAARDWGTVVTSGVDWFDLEVKANFGEQSLELPELLQAINKKSNFIKLKDGSQGIIPEHVISKLEPLANLGDSKNVKEGFLRFQQNHATFLAELLEEMPDAQVDEKFEDLRQKLRNLNGIFALKESKGFKGKLRTYQREGLGWLQFLHEYGFGGCLADDMGLGKTVQILAFIDRLNAQKGAKITKKGKKSTKPVLLVAPRSLIYNWIQETERFTDLKIIDYSRYDRSTEVESFSEADIIITTYGIMRSDIVDLKKIHFSLAVLDEAQAIKNFQSQSAKAARLLKADHRICLSGTPIENHLGEFWSLFEFMNPGFLKSTSMKRFANSTGYDLNEESRDFLIRAIRPFLLRRTKSEVLKDLPDKVEKRVYCELPPSQREEYDELKAYYHQKIQEKIQLEGKNKAQFLVLEGLLRLRQVSLHPGLLDESMLDSESGKVDFLLESLEEVIEGNHKALIFSQFTGMLNIVKKKFEELGFDYAYLDGKTRDRQKVVDQFQNDDACKLFLISLKAGGVGLNLTSADYCFVLDPWWNPAVEAQAIDRAHRIGQKNKVFAYKIIAKDTVEERILELQDRKKGLSDAVLSADGSLIKNLSGDSIVELFE